MVKGVPDSTVLFSRIKVVYLVRPSAAEKGIRRLFGRPLKLPPCLQTGLTLKDTASASSLAVLGYETSSGFVRLSRQAITTYVATATRPGGRREANMKLLRPRRQVAGSMAAIVFSL